MKRDDQKLAFRWGSAGLAIYRNGTQVATGGTFTEPVLGANLYIGSDDAGANQAYATLGDSRVWNRYPTNAEMQAVTQ